SASIRSASVGNPSIGNPSVGNPSVGNSSVGNSSVGNSSVGNAGVGTGSWPPRERLEEVVVAVSESDIHAVTFREVRDAVEKNGLAGRSLRQIRRRSERVEHVRGCIQVSLDRKSVV